MLQREHRRHYLARLSNGNNRMMTTDLTNKVGIGNAISDGHLVVYYPHLLVHPDYERNGIGSGIMKRLAKRYTGFHQQMLTADVDALAFYEQNGFVRAGKTIPMWVYAGDEH